LGKNAYSNSDHTSHKKAIVTLPRHLAFKGQ
jgi:hypothetical protein